MKRTIFSIIALLLIVAGFGYLYWQNTRTLDALTSFMSMTQYQINEIHTTLTTPVSTGTTTSGDTMSGTVIDTGNTASAGTQGGVWGSASETPLVNVVMNSSLKREVSDMTADEIKAVVGISPSMLIGERYTANDTHDDLTVLNGAAYKQYFGKEYALTVDAIKGSGSMSSGLYAAFGQAGVIIPLQTKKIVYSGTTNAMMVVALYGQSVPAGLGIFVYALSGDNVLRIISVPESDEYTNYLWQICADQYKIDDKTRGDGDQYKQAESCYEKKVNTDKYIQYLVAQKLSNLLRIYALQ